MTVVRYLPLILCAILIGLFGFTLLNGKAANSSPLIGKPLPHFAMSNVFAPSEILSPATIRKPALIVFWASWCGICRVDLPVVSKFAQDNNLPLYGIAYRDQTDALKAAVIDLEKLVTFTGLGQDNTGSVSSQYGLIGVPTLFAVDKNGVVRTVIAGQASLSELNTDVRPLLQ